ncbi:MAG: DUF262 domain-containing protein [Rhodospirillales bacterium]|nr:DUF262 domain-containing protein [Alphaproteobacteria bacterium]MCB9976755.1 DUF262 domain-containing protein [Rhodospirillales bacterium]
MNDKNEEDLEIEEEIDETPYVEFDISVSPSDPTLELLAQQLDNDDIIIPFYQRKYVWKIEQASKLIESFLMGLPVPQVFFYVNNENQLEVIDGQQRMMSVKYFFEGYFGEEDAKGNRQVFKLKGLSERSEYNGKTFEQLSSKDQRKLRNSTLRAINIRQLKPEPQKDNAVGDSVFHIFERLNTGGTSLKPQEIRNAVYRGNIVEELKKLNAIPEWQKILGLSKPDKNQKDVELVLRLFGLFENWESYQKPMLSFLNKTMKENTEFSSDRAQKFIPNFERVVKFISNCIEKPFRPKRVINSAALEGVMVALLESKTPDEATFKTRYEKLMSDEDFISKIRGGTTDQKVLVDRIKRARDVLINGTA